MISEYTRASDADRNDTCQVLDAALAEGQLSTEEHRERVSTATRATTLGELRSLVDDLQINAAPAQPPAPRSAVGARSVWIVLAAALLLGAGIWWVLQRDEPAAHSPSGTPTAATAGPTPPSPNTTTPPQPQLLTLGGLSEVLAQMRAQFGDTLGYQLNIYQDQAVLERPDTANPQKVVAWLYRDGNWANVGPKSAVASRLAVGDLGKFDVQAVVGVAQQAPQTLHIYDAGRLYLTIESRKDGGLNLHIHVSDGALSGNIALAPDGTVMQIAPPPR